MTRAQGRRKSQFPGNTVIPADATLDFVSDGVNYKIPLADFLSALSVTGSIVQDGDVTGTPVLDVQGAVNLIRNLETDSNSGLRFSVSAENGIYAALDAQSDGVGVAVLQTDNTIRKMLAGSGIAIAASNGDIVVSTTAVPGATRVVVVNVLADFPSPVGGVIPLSADTVYFINDLVDVGVNTFSLASNTVIQGLSATVTGIISSATGTLFLNAGGFESDIGGISITAPNCTVVGVTSGGGTADVFMHGIDIKSCVTAANINGAFLFRFEDSGIDTSSGDTFVFSGTNGLVNISTAFILDFTGTAFDLGTATFNRVNIDIMQIVSPSGSNLILDGAADSGNIDVGGIGDMSEIVVIGAFTASTNIVSGDTRWTFSDNSFIADSHTDGLLSMQANALATTIGVIGTPVLVAGTWVVEHDDKMTGTAGGRLTYDAQRDIHIPIIASLTVSPAAGNNRVIGVYAALNGVVVANSKRTATVSSSSSASITMPWSITLETDDYIEVFVVNDTSTDNVLVSSAVLSVE